MIHAIGYRSLIAKIKDSTGELAPTVDHSSGGFEDKPNQYFILESSERFQPGNYSLEFKFEYMLRTDLKGFYLSNYTSNDGEKR